MVAVQHRQLAFAVGHRRDKYIVANLNFHRTELRRDLAAQCLAIDNVTAFDRHDFAFRDVRRRKQAAPMNLALAHFRLWREVRKSHHGIELQTNTNLQGLFFAAKTNREDTRMAENSSARHSWIIFLFDNPGSLPSTGR